MAFQQPQQRPQAARHASFSQPAPASESAKTVAKPASSSSIYKKQLEEPQEQEWVLFAPSLDDQQSITSRTSQAPRTANFSRFSDIDSLETGLRSGQALADEQTDDLTCQGTDLDDDEAAELDSLDDGLHAFHAPLLLSPRLDQSGGTVLPMHDGLGTFPSTYQHAAPQDMQEHLWQFERFNPHRRRQQRRRSSVQKRLDAIEDDEETHRLDKQEERRLRIEKWRLEQSRAVLEEIERETRRRTRTMSVMSGQSSAVPATEHDSMPQDHHSARVAQLQSSIKTPAAPTEDDAEMESFWQRITRKVIKDLMGLDETTLSVIFGEELPLSVFTPPVQSPPVVASSETTWEQRLIERIARELGILAQGLSELEGKAFSTYTNQPRAFPSPPNLQQKPHLLDLTSTATPPLEVPPSSEVLFKPTLPTETFATATTTDTSLWGIEEEPAPQAQASSPSVLPDNVRDPQADKEYWERDLDVGVIFRYLRNRFSSRPTSPTPSERAAPAPPPPLQTQATTIPEGPLPPSWASPDQGASALGTSPESLRRADMIRKNHPLVSHAATVSATRRRESMLLRRQHQFLMQRRSCAQGSSSCASQSTKRTRSGGSRRYWDFPGVGVGAGAGAGGAAGSIGGAGGSVAGGSAISVTSAGYEGMMGSWGEV